jgi:hypothetical protein
MVCRRLFRFFLDQRERAKMKWEQDPNQNNVTNLNSVRVKLADISGKKRRNT